MKRNSRNVVSGLFPAIVLIGVLLPMLLYTNLESMKNYLTTIKLMNSVGNVLNDTTYIFFNLNSSTSLLDSHHQHLHDVTSLPIIKAEMPVTVMNSLNN